MAASALVTAWLVVSSAPVKAAKAVMKARKSPVFIPPSFATSAAAAAKITACARTGKAELKAASPLAARRTA